MSEQASGNFISVSERLKRFKPASGRRTVKHYPTGIKKLDQMLGGGLYAGLTFLGARPGMGKSTLRCRSLQKLRQPVRRYCFTPWRCHLSVWRQKY